MHEKLVQHHLSLSSHPMPYPASSQFDRILDGSLSKIVDYATRGASAIGLDGLFEKAKHLVSGTARRGYREAEDVAWKEREADKERLSMWLDSSSTPMFVSGSRGSGQHRTLLVSFILITLRALFD